MNFSLAQPITKNSGDITETFRFNLGTTFNEFFKKLFCIIFFLFLFSQNSFAKTSCLY